MRSLLRKSTSRSGRRCSLAARPTVYRPRLEWLEDRRLLALTTIVDDGDGGFAVNDPDDWQAAGYGYQSDSLLPDVPEPAGTRWAEWTFSVTPGEYKVAATWVSDPTYRATNAPFQVIDVDAGLTVDTVLINQRQAPNDFSQNSANWETLFAEVKITGTTMKVRLTDAGVDSYIIADAVGIEDVGDLDSGPDVAVIFEGYDVAHQSEVDFGTTGYGQELTKTVTVMNQGGSTLNLGSFGTMPAAFTIDTGFGDTSLDPGEHTTFTVQLLSTAPGSKGGDNPISFDTNDTGEDPFEFDVDAEVTDVAIIDDSDEEFTVWSEDPPYTWFIVDPHYDAYKDNLTYANPFEGEEYAPAAAWTFLVAPGRHRISATWVAEALVDFGENVMYSIDDLDRVIVNQGNVPNDFNDAGAAWEDLGTYDVVGNTLTIKIYNVTVDGDGVVPADGYVIADAIRVERVGEQPATQEVTLLMQDTDFLHPLPVEDEADEYAPVFDYIADGGTTGTQQRYWYDRLITDDQSYRFKVVNSGQQTLTLSDLAVSSDYSILNNFSDTSLAPGETATFDIQLDEVDPGTYNGTIYFTTNDSDEGTYNFTISTEIRDDQVKDQTDTDVTFTGSWITSDELYYMYFDYFEAVAGTASSSITADVTWDFTVTPGVYRIAATWAANPYYSDDMAVKIFDVDASSTTPVETSAFDFTEVPDDFRGDLYDPITDWEYLRSGGNPIEVEITGELLRVYYANNTTGYISADAIRIERIGDLPEMLMGGGGGGGESESFAFLSAESSTEGASLAEALETGIGAEELATVYWTDEADRLAAVRTGEGSGRERDGTSSKPGVAVDQRKPRDSAVDTALADWLGDEAG